MQTRASTAVFDNPSRCRRAWIASAVAFLASTAYSPAPAASGGCQFAKLLDLPVMMEGAQPHVTVTMNGSEVRLILDSGAFYSMISPASAAQLKLRTVPAPLGFYVVGVGGNSQAGIATVKSFGVGASTLSDVQFLVGGNEFAVDTVGLLGRNFLSLADAEYDFSHGSVRLWVPKQCEHSVLAYWVKQSEPYSVIDLLHPAAETSLGSHVASQRPRLLQPLIGTVSINGVALRASFDTGASTSMLSRKAAERVGIKLDSPGVTLVGYTAGVGRTTVATYAAPVESFKIGEEEIRNTRLYVGDTELNGTDMLLGIDFFLSHHVFVALSQNKLYFTYNGGPVFKFEGKHQSEPLSASGAPASDGGGAGQTSPAAPDDPAEHARVGEALASRHEYQEALAELSTACKLAPDNAEYLYQRAKLYAITGRRDAALSDLNQALTLKANDPLLLMTRADFNLQKGDRSTLAADLDAAAAATANEADLRFFLGDVYERADLLGPALAQYDLWIAAHPTDVRLPVALANRCRVRALQGAQLPLALKDCDAALKHMVKGTSSYAQTVSTRALVRLRSGEYRKSEEDYSAALAIEPRDAWSLYGRGIDELHDRHTTEGNADIGKAATIRPQVAQEFTARGISSP